MTNGANGYWKWFAAILVTMLLMGIIPIAQSLRTPSKAEVDLIHERQNQVRADLVLIKFKIAENLRLLKTIQAELIRHERQTR